ncbi:MAG: TetR/AcrR family transcriptional regulator [Candidatus Eremiobacteraeota bacterium]|nr:TetR/AcrR family transcriptional regulator [Candidatus Eremiobacteraeota bacterium]
MIEERENVRSASPEETRLRILTAARQVMGQRGKRGATTREIADRAGVNEATLFRHFGHKDALIMAAAQHFCGLVELKKMTDLLSGDLQDDLCAVATALTNRMETVRDLIIMSLAEENDDSPEVGMEAWRVPAAIHLIIVDYMTRRVESGELSGDPRSLARFFMGMIFSHVVGRKKFPSDAILTPEQIVNFQVGMFLNGAKNT